MGIRGEPNRPEDSAQGKVWKEIIGHLDEAGFLGTFVSISDLERERLHHHPWSIGGGGAADLRNALEESSQERLEERIETMGFGAITREDELFELPLGSSARLRIPPKYVLTYGSGERVRDWGFSTGTDIVFPYSEAGTVPLSSLGRWANWAWRYRSQLWLRQGKGFKTKRESGGAYHEYSMFYPDRHYCPFKITWGEIATHNHFVLDRGGRVFNRTAPVLKLKLGATEADHLGLLGALNSSTACFWMKQVCHNKGSTVDSKGARQRTAPFEDFWAFNSTKIAELPVASEQPLVISRELDRLANSRALLKADITTNLSASSLARIRESAEAARVGMIALQEDLDWFCYHAYRLLDDDLTFPADQLPPVTLGERAFEILMARKMATGELQTTWFDRHGSKPITEIPAHWPAAYRQLVERRIAAIESNPNIRLIEQPEYKRRWNDEPWEEQQKHSLRGWLLDRIEAPKLWSTPKPVSCARLADQLRDDQDFLQVAAIYRGHPDFDLTNLVVELAEAEAVPYWTPLLYTSAGLRKRQVWEHTWDLQRREDAIDSRTTLPPTDPQHIDSDAAQALKAKEVGKIAPPPKYANTDFLKNTSWRLRGKLDVPKERFIIYPGAERGADTTPVIGWAGWDHLQQAQALAAHYLEALELESWPVERLLPLLAGLLELVPWLKQWHNELDPSTGERMGDYFESFVSEHARRHGTTIDGLRDLQPIAPAKKPRRTKKATP